VCGAKDALPHLQKGELHLVCCAQCSMIYANPVGAEFASGEYYDRDAAQYYLSRAKLDSDYAGVRYERELRLFREHCQSGTVLDVGCGSGAFLHQLRVRYPSSYEILGTDVSGAPLDYAESQGIPVWRGDFLSGDLGGERIDAVTFWAVLEHLLEPKKFIERAASLLKPGGSCFVLVPNMDSLAVRMIGVRYRYIYPQHLNYFTRETLGKLAENHFSIIELRATHFNPVVIYQDWRSGGADVSNAERGELLKRTTGYKQNPLFKPVKAAYNLAEKTLALANLADNLMAVLRKK
jgi:2-polyprenyl-3-methyl-5-hydroxy-6-metoxy-1,4-benzoquinol methylase